jgi:UDP-N-acetylmuramyl pentapeptide phosphotransferase/UDP-N-acetylglucosamine-1-phosphate transferase
MRDSAFCVALASGAAVVTYLLITALKPVMARYALARPNARSSHTIPTPQGGGLAIAIAIICATLVSTAWHSAGWADPALLCGATAVLAAVGALDDIFVLPTLPRLGFQFGAAIVVVITLHGQRVVPWLPEVVELPVLVLAIVWFVNLVNFMDGIDWMSVVEVVPITIGIAIVAWHDNGSSLTFDVAIALGAAMIGFAPFNRPVASLFLGDVGSLPIGLLVAWLLLELAVAGHVAAAILLPLYYLADATLTLGRRLMRRERVWEAHRTHFYQRATQRGWSVKRVVGLVFVENAILCSLAIASTEAHGAVCVVLGAISVAALLAAFVRVRA